MNVLKYIIGLSSLGIVLSCAKDLGNYEYQDINEITITDIENNYSRLTAIDTLKINPKIELTENITDPSRLEYIWVIKQNNNVIDTAGREKELKYPIKLAPNNYVIQLRIQDKTTKVTWTKKANLAIGTQYSRGIYVIGENTDGNAELDLISMVRDTFIVRNIIKESGLPTLRGPLFAQHTGGNDATMKMWISTNTGGYYVDRVTLKGNPSSTFGKLIYTTDNIDKGKEFPAVLAPQIISSNGNNGNIYNRAILTNTGNIYANSIWGAPDFYANPINRLKTSMNTLIKSAPYIFYSLGNLNSILWYDSNKDRFLNFTSLGFNTFSEPLTDATTDPFPWNQESTGRKLIYGENTRNSDGGSAQGNSFAILKDASSACFVYKFYANGGLPSKKSMYTIKPIATDFDKADHYAFSSIRTLIFYSVGSKLYAYDYNPGNEKVYQFPTIGYDPISMLKFDTQIDPSTNSLYIATYNNATKGTLRRFTVGNNPDNVEIQAVTKAQWDGLVKVKNFSWRAVN